MFLIIIQIYKNMYFLCSLINYLQSLAVNFLGYTYYKNSCSKFVRSFIYQNHHNQNVLIFHRVFSNHSKTKTPPKQKKKKKTLAPSPFDSLVLLVSVSAVIFSLLLCGALPCLFDFPFLCPPTLLEPIFEGFTLLLWHPLPFLPPPPPLLFSFPLKCCVFSYPFTPST